MPSPTTTMRSARMAVESRCAISTAVRPSQQHVQRRLHHRLGLQVQVRGGLVEHEHAGLGHEGPPERDELALARGQRLAPLVDRRVEAVGEPVHQLAQPDLVHGVPHLVVGRARSGERDVVPDGPGEEERLLGHDAELGAQRGSVTRLEVVARR